MTVKESGSGQLNAVIKGDTDYDGISLSFFEYRVGKYVLATSTNPGDHITIDISAGETSASYEGRTYVSIPLEHLPGYSEYEYNEWIYKDEDEEFDEAGLRKKISSFITVKDNDDIGYDLDIDDGDLIFKFYEDSGEGKDVSLRGWSLTDENIKDADEGYVELSQSNKEDGDDFIEGYVVSPAKNRIATVLSGTTGLKEIRLFFENDGDDDEDRKLSFGENERDEVVIDVERSEAFEAGEESVVMIDKEYFENTGDVDKIIMWTKNTGVSVSMSEVDITDEVDEDDEDDEDDEEDKPETHHFFKYVFTAGSTSEESVSDNKEEQLKKSMSENKACNPVSEELTGGYVVSYNSVIPYFGKSLKKNDISSLGITVSLNGVTYKAVKGKIVRLKGAEESDEKNASIVITKLEGDGDNKALKKAQKDVKKATKAKADKLGAITCRIYAFRLSDATASELSGLTAGGKAGKYSLKFTYNGKKQTIKQKKDSFGNKDEGTWTVNDAGLTVSTNDIQGSVSPSGFTNKTK